MSKAIFPDSRSRRSLLKGAAAAATLAAAPWARPARAAEPLYINTWGGPWDKAAQQSLFEPFTRDTGIPIRTVSPVSFSRLASQARTGVYEFDVTEIGGSELMRAIDADLLEPIDTSIIDVQSLAPGQVIGSGVAVMAFSTVIAWRKDKFQQPPQSWPEFWDTRQFPGGRSLQRYAARVVPLALVADGADTHHLYPLDLDRGFGSLDRIKSSIRTWWSQGQQSYQLLGGGEVSAIGMWHSRVQQLMGDGAPVDFTWNQQQIDRGFWVVSKGSPRAKAGWRFIASILRAEHAAQFCMLGGYSPVDPRVFEQIPQTRAVAMPTYPANYRQAIEQDFAALAPQLNALTSRFDRWVMR